MRVPYWGKGLVVLQASILRHNRNSVQSKIYGYGKG
jgi:hypothetical protein